MSNRLLTQAELRESLARDLASLKKPRWRWIWECSWWERGTETTFEVWAPNWPRPIAALRPQKQP